jgi:hypothetical protein
LSGKIAKSKGSHNPLVAGSNPAGPNCSTTTYDDTSADSKAPRPRLDQTRKLDDDLASVIDAWPTLPDALKAGILAMIDSARKQNARADAR